MNDKPEILTREEVLQLLSQKAREGTTSAMIALERALRLDPSMDDELERLLRED